MDPATALYSVKLSVPLWHDSSFGSLHTFKYNISLTIYLCVLPSSHIPTSPQPICLPLSSCPHGCPLTFPPLPVTSLPHQAAPSCPAVTPLSSVPVTWPSAARLLTYLHSPWSALQHFTSPCPLTPRQIVVVAPLFRATASKPPPAPLRDPLPGNFHFGFLPAPCKIYLPLLDCLSGLDPCLPYGPVSLICYCCEEIFDLHHLCPFSSVCGS